MNTIKSSDRVVSLKSFWYRMEIIIPTAKPSNAQNKINIFTIIIEYVKRASDFQTFV